MLMDKMRQGAQSLTAKIIFVIIMVSFALAGIGGYAVRKPNTDPAEVDGVTIHAQEFDRAYHEKKQRVQHQFAEHYQEIIAANPNFLQSLRQQTLNELIDNVIMDLRVAKLGIRVGDDVIKQIIIKDIDAFKVDGKFNNDQYMSVITRYGYTSAAQFAHDQKILNQQALYADSFRSSQFSLPYENIQLLALQKQERAVEVYNLAPESFQAEVKVEPEELTKFYNDHSKRYSQPEQVKVDYILLNKDDLAKNLTVSDADLQKFYEENQERFTEKGKYHVEHIFVNAPKESDKEAAKAKIADIQAKLKAGELFETVASQSSDDVLTANKGGDLGWQPYGTLEKEFEEAVKTLQNPNDVSDIIETQYGYHIIKFLERKEDRVKPLEDVKESIIAKINSTKVDDVFAQKLDQLTNLANEMPDDLKGIAKESGLEIKTSNYFDANTSVVPFDNAQVQKLVFDPSFRDDGLASEPIHIGNDSAVVVYVTDYKPAYVKSQDEIKDQLEKDYRISNSEAIALSKARELEKLLQAKDQNGIEQFVQANKVDLKKVDNLKRTDSSFDSAIVEGIFAMPRAAADVVNTKVLEGLDSHKYVAILKTVTNYSGEASDSDQAMMGAQIKQINSVRDHQLLIKQLRADSKVELNSYALKQYATMDQAD